MAYDLGLAERLKDCVADEDRLSETRMFGGFGYLMHGNMCIGIHKEWLIVRVGVDVSERIIGEPGVTPMDITGKAMKGWAKIDAEGLEEEADLRRYCQYALDFVSTLPPKK